MGDTVRIDPRALVDLIRGWADGDGALYQLLADAIGHQIATGTLPAGARLPAERSLALALPASRGTVVAAYGALAERSLVERHQGRGTTVRSGELSRLTGPALDAGLRAQTLTGRAIDPGGRSGRSDGRGTIELGLSVLDDPTSLPDEAFAVDAETLARAGRGHGYAPLGIRPLRERVAELLTARGVPTAPDEVAITLGAQHGIALATAALAGAGDAVAIEDPTYPAAIDVFSRAGMELCALRSDGGGTDPAALRSVLAGTAARLVYLMPQCASPTGVVTTAARMAELGDVLAASDAWLVEDAALEFLVPQEGQRFLTATRPDRSVLVGTVSKVFWGGLRVGWLRAPAPVVDHVGRVRAAHDLGSSIAAQVSALRLLDDLEAIAAGRRDEADRRRRFTVERIRERMPAVTCPEPAGGLSLWLGVEDAGAVVREAAWRGLDVVHGPVCSVTGGCENRIRMSTWAPIPVLAEAVDRLAAAVAAC